MESPQSPQSLVLKCSVNFCQFCLMMCVDSLKPKDAGSGSRSSSCAGLPLVPTSVLTAALLTHHRPLALEFCWLCFPPLPVYWICLIPNSAPALNSTFSWPLKCSNLRLVSVRDWMVSYHCDCWGQMEGYFCLFPLV